MEKFKENKITLKWEFAGKFEAVIVNGLITELSFCEEGKGTGDCGACLTSTDYKHLKNVHQGLSDLFRELDTINDELGHKFANDEA